VNPREESALDFLHVSNRPTKDAVPMDPVLGLRTDIIDFFQFNMRKIKASTEAQKEILEIMMNNARANTLNHDQLERLFSLLGSDLRQSADSFFSLFKPTPGAVSPLANLLGEKDPTDEASKDMLKTLTPEKLATIDGALRILAAVAERAKAAENLKQANPPTPEAEEEKPDESEENSTTQA